LALNAIYGYEISVRDGNILRRTHQLSVYHCSSLYTPTVHYFTVYYIHTVPEQKRRKIWAVTHSPPPVTNIICPCRQTHRGSQYCTTERPTGISINHAGHVSPCGVHYSEYQSFSKRQNNNQYSTPNSYLELGFFFSLARRVYI